MSRDSANFDVLVVGFGPVGQVAANLLAVNGHSVAAFERHADPYPYSRAGLADHEAMRIFQSFGLADRIASDTIVLNDYEWVDTEGNVMLPLSFPAGPSGWDAHGIFQPEVEEKLSQAAADAGVEINRGTEVVGLTAHSDGVSVETQGPGGRRRLRGRYLIGADGANSFVRRALSTPVTDLGFEYPWIVVDLEPRRQLEFAPIVTQVCDPARPTTIGPLGPHRRRFEFMLLPGEDPERMCQEETVWELLSPWVGPGDVSLLRHPVYTFRAQWADRWRQGPAFLAGDAAHLMPPFLGQGMNSGIRDAKNLCWKLDLVLRGVAPESVLDSYEIERLPQARFLTEESVQMGRFMCITDPEAAAARDEQLRAQARANESDGTSRMPIPAPPPLSGPLIADGAPLAGTLSLQGRIRHWRGEGLFDDVFGSGTALIGRGADPAAALDPAQRAFLDRLGAAIAHFDGNNELRAGSFEDLDGTYGGWFDEAGVEAVLVRPDFWVYGGASAADQLPSLVDSLAAALSSPP